MNRPLIRTTRARWGALAVAIVAALTVSLPAGAAMAAAEPISAEASDEFTTQSIDHWFGVRNLTTHPMTARGVFEVYPGQAPRFGDDPPANAGEVFEPGLEDFFKMTFWVWYTNGAYLHYQIGDVGTVAMKVTLDPWLGTPTWECFGTVGPLTCTISGGSAFIMTNEPTARVLESSQQQEQADALKTLCDVENPHVSCSFDAKGELVEALGQGTLKGDISNFNCKSQTLSRYTFTWGLEQSTSTSVGGSLTVGGTIKKLVEVSVSATFNQTWSWTDVRQDSHAADIAPGYWTWIEAYPAALRVTGDFTAVIGNDTLIIRDVTFESPDPRQLGNGVIGSLERIMVPAERVQFCHETPEVAERRYSLVLAASPDGAAEAPDDEAAAAEAAATEAPAFSDPAEIAAFTEAFEAAG